MSNAETAKSKKRKGSKKKSAKISFDDEIVPKGEALKSNSKPLTYTEDYMDTECHNQNISQEQDLTAKPPKHERVKENKKQKRKKKKESDVAPKPEIESESNELAEEMPELNPANPKIEKPESMRARKRRKHEQLLSAKKLKIDLTMQAKCLNYLSHWKHDRSDWKFEKLRQVWLQQNMFDCDKIPDQYWEMIVEYFSNSKGIIRQTIIDDALKSIEKGEGMVDPKPDDEKEEAKEDYDTKRNKIKVERAKSIIQSLQE